MAGMVPIVGNAVDLTNAGISAMRGDAFGAGASLAAAVPFVGLAAGGAKIGSRFARVAKFGDEAATLQRYTDEAAASVRLTPKQAQAAGRNPSLESMFRGERIDAAVRKRVAENPELGLTATPRGKWGPDFFDKSGPLPRPRLGLATSGSMNRWARGFRFFMAGLSRARRSAVAGW